MNKNHKKWHQGLFAYLSCPPDCAVALCLVAGERVGAVRWVSEGQGTQMLQWSGFVSAQETFVELAAESAGTARKLCFVKNNASLVASGKWYKAYLTSVYNVNKVLYFFSFHWFHNLFLKSIWQIKHIQVYWTSEKKIWSRWKIRFTLSCSDAIRRHPDRCRRMFHLDGLTHILKRKLTK